MRKIETRACACGCGTTLTTPDSRGRPRRFINGHCGRPTRSRSEKCRAAVSKRYGRIIFIPRPRPKPKLTARELRRLRRREAFNG